MAFEMSVDDDDDDELSEADHFHSTQAKKKSQV